MAKRARSAYLMEELTGRPPVQAVKGDLFRHRPATRNGVGFDGVEVHFYYFYQHPFRFLPDAFTSLSRKPKAPRNQDFPRAEPYNSSLESDSFLAKERTFCGIVHVELVAQNTRPTGTHIKIISNTAIQN